MTSEFDLTCVSCGTPLSRDSISADRLGFGDAGSVEVASCPDCGDTYFPEATLERLG